MDDPAFEPAIPVLMLMGACDRDDLDLARQWLSPELLDDINGSADGWDAWWEDARSRLSGIDLSAWTVSLAELGRHSRWGFGHRVTLAPSEEVRPQPGGVTSGGTPYEVTTLEGESVRAVTFWTVETAGGWRLRGFGVE